MELGLALGSGGAKGIAHIAYLEVLDSLGIGTKAIAGASMGALVGAFYAAGLPASALREIACDFTLRDLPRIIDFSGPRDSGFIKGRKIEDWLAEKLPVRRFEELQIPLKVVATDFWRREQAVFDSGELIPAIRASISFPGVIEPYEIDGALLVDGGLVNPVPFDLLDGCDFIVAIDVSGPRPAARAAYPKQAAPGEEKDPGRLEILLGSLAIMSKAIMDRRALDDRIALYLRPALAGFRSADFLKAREILDSVRDEAFAFREELLRRGFGAASRADGA